MSLAAKGVPVLLERHPLVSGWGCLEGYIHWLGFLSEAPSMSRTAVNSSFVLGPKAYNLAPMVL